MKTLILFITVSATTFFMWYLAFSFIYLDLTLNWFYDYIMEGANNRGVLIVMMIFKAIIDLFICAGVEDFIIKE